MGRPRGFDERTVVTAATELFVRRGYEATSVDDLVAATNLHRGSLYKAFGSKRGIFLAALHATSGDAPAAGTTLDLLLVAALELAPDDDDVRALLARGCTRLATTDEDVATVLGRRLLHRAGLLDSTDPEVDQWSA